MSFQLRTILNWAGFLSFLSCSTANQKPVLSQVSTGLLTIRCAVEQTDSQAWYNLGGKPGDKIDTPYFSVDYGGKPVSVGTAEGPVTRFWQALFLKDAPRPAALVATHSVYLITDDNGRAIVKPVDI